MGSPFDDPKLAARYEAWYAGRGRRADRLEKRLLDWLLTDFPDVESVLEVGCGTGHFTRWLAEHGWSVTGLDASEVMLHEARKLNGLPYVLGDALAMPFEDRSFDIVALITTLEFVGDPQRALREATRVARCGLVLGVLNRWSMLALRRGTSPGPPWRAARFFSPAEVSHRLRAAAGSRIRRIRWRTTLWPIPGMRSLPLPWGGFIGMSAALGPT